MPGLNQLPLENVAYIAASKGVEYAGPVESRTEPES
jgi:hypothetical protein